MEIARLLRVARRYAGMTQSELGRRAGTSQATVSAYETGSKVPSAATLARLLAAAGMRLEALPASRPVITPSASELERRGRILAQVVDLAERLPSRRGPDLAYPPLHELVRSPS